MSWEMRVRFPPEERDTFSLIDDPTFNYMVAAVGLNSGNVPRDLSFGTVHAWTSKASFILTSNAKLESEPYDVRDNINLTACAQMCRQQIKCQSIVFYKNYSSSICELRSKTESSVSYDRSTSPNVASYYFEKICLPGQLISIHRDWEPEVKRRVALGWQAFGRLNNVWRSKLPLCLKRKEQMFEALRGRNRIRCRSVEFDELSIECHLSRYDRFNRNSAFMSTKASSYYFDNTCAYDSDIGTRRTGAEILLLGNVDHPYSLEEHANLSVSDCGQLCLESKQFPCRSFLYGQRGNSKFCGLTHQNRIGLLRTPGSFLPTDTINYYEIARNLDFCDSNDISLELISGTYLDVPAYKEVDDKSPMECTQICKNESRCQSLNIDYDAGVCKFLSESIQLGVDERVKTSPNINHFEKACVFGGDKCDGQWAFERVKSKTLIGVHTKLIVRANTKEEFHTIDSPPNDKYVRLEDAKLVVDYFENNCYTEARGFCNLKKIQQRAQILADEISQTSSLENCKESCFKSKGFICRSFTYDWTSRLCQHSHHTRHSVPNNGLRPAPTTDYYDINTCFEVAVTCEPDRMVADVKTNKMFRGKIYAKSQPSTCQVDISHSTHFTLPVPLVGARCGTITEAEGKFSNVIVIQANDRVVTSVDKAVGVHCSYQVGNKTEEATLSFNVTDLNASDSARGAPELPKLSMRIVDVGTYGIFLRNMVARSAVDDSELTLIDNIGCPVEVKMMKEVRRLDGGKKALESYLEAFSFTGSNLLKIETEVETCINNYKFDVEEESNLICVDPTMAALIASIVLFFQGITIAICIVDFAKNKIRKKEQEEE
ncbi:hypothetical protein GQR58_025497 [Nymphon striatum]|nr:hypothetical protein GQR58_025497 [Nymphon striatum]